jgi:hypothetical protein
MYNLLFILVCHIALCGTQPVLLAAIEKDLRCQQSGRFAAVLGPWESSGWRSALF